MINEVEILVLNLIKKKTNIIMERCAITSEEKIQSLTTLLCVHKRPRRICIHEYEWSTW